MDRKYVGKTLALPKDVADALQAVREEVSAKLGFTPSLSETVSYLINHYTRGRTTGATHE